MRTFQFQHPTPFDPKLNAAIIYITTQLVGRFEVADNAPSTFQQLHAHLEAGKTLVVASEGSSNTVFCMPEVNYAFRAWHDWCHWWGGFDFSMIGETATCGLQIGHLKQFYGRNDQTEVWANLLTAEIIGQRQYYERHGVYVEDQRGFSRAYRRDANLALSSHW